VAKDPNTIKFKVFTSLLLEEVPIEGELFARVPQIRMEDWDLNDREKLMHLDPNKYLKVMYYEESDVTSVEPMKWVASIQHA